MPPKKQDKSRETRQPYREEPERPAAPDDDGDESYPLAPETFPDDD